MEKNLWNCQSNFDLIFPQQMLPESESLEYLAAAVHGGVVSGEVEEPLLGVLLYPLTHRQPGVVGPRGGGVACQGKVGPRGDHLPPHHQVGLWS